MQLRGRIDDVSLVLSPKYNIAHVQHRRHATEHVVLVLGRNPHDVHSFFGVGVLHCVVHAAVGYLEAVGASQIVEVLHVLEVEGGALFLCGAFAKLGMEGGGGGAMNEGLGCGGFGGGGHKGVGNCR